MIFVFWSWVPFGSHFGGVLGAQMEAKAFKKALQKNIKRMIPKMSPNWSPRGSQNGAKIVKNEVLEASCFKGGSQVASRAPPGSILERFWDYFGTVFVSCFQHVFDYFCMHHVAACCKQKRSNSQGVIKECSRELPRNSFPLRAILH